MKKFKLTSEKAPYKASHKTNKIRRRSVKPSEEGSMDIDDSMDIDEEREDEELERESGPSSSRVAAQTDASSDSEDTPLEQLLAYRPRLPAKRNQQPDIQMKERDAGK